MFVASDMCPAGQRQLIVSKCRAIPRAVSKLPPADYQSESGGQVEFDGRSSAFCIVIGPSGATVGRTRVSDGPFFSLLPWVRPSAIDDSRSRVGLWPTTKPLALDHELAITDHALQRSREGVRASDMYGSRGRDMDQLRIDIETVIGIQFEAHWSDMRGGDYFLWRSKDSSSQERLSIIRNHHVDRYGPPAWCAGY